MSKRQKPKKRQVVPAWPADPKIDPMYPFGGPPPLDPAEPDSLPHQGRKPKTTWGQLKKEYR